MSYDLYFCQRAPTNLHFDQVVEWSRQYPDFRKDGDSQLIYENQNTGVYFILECSEQAQGEDPGIPTGVHPTGLSLSLNYARPTFFALEAMPIAEALASHLGLTTFDPQGGPTDGMQSSEQLIRSWSKSNQQVTESLAKDSDTFFRLSPETAFQFWTYMHGDYPRLSRELEKPDVYVPRMFIIRNKNSKRAETAIAWTIGVHLVIPRCDWIVVVFPKSFWRRETEMFFFRSESVLKAMAPYLKEFDQRCDLQVLPPENRSRADRILKGLEGGQGKAGFETLSPDRCVDVLTAQNE